MHTLHCITCDHRSVNRSNIPRISEVSSLSSVLEHAMYCGMSLGRMGLDFRALLPPLFDAAVLAVFRRVLAVSLDRCLTALATHRWTTVGRDRRPPGGPGAPADGADEGAPPMSLMEHPPLAMLANGVLAAFNELRHCAALSLRAPVVATLQVWVLARCMFCCQCASVVSLVFIAFRSPFSPHCPLFFPNTLTRNRRRFSR